MNYKERNLFNKIYTAFIKGEYGPPKIPSKDEVLEKMQEITTSEYKPLAEDTPMQDIDIKQMREKFSNIIDDIDILFDSVESESKDVLDQLTDSLKEHNGVKRELRKISTTADNINKGKLGEEYLEYSFTEDFSDTDNIDTLRSDPINSEAGIFTIRRDSDNILSLRHYFDSKLEFNILENHAVVIENGYVGTTDAGAMLDQNDPREIVYKVTTNRPTRLKAGFVLQLKPDAKPAEINAVTVDLDAKAAGGSVQVFYKDEFVWKDFKNGSSHVIKSNRAQFSFPSVKTTHLKFEFIKNSPDIPDTNTYYFIINNIAVAKGNTRKTATLYSTPIRFAKYSNETPIVTTLSASGVIDIPTNCTAKLYVAQDKEITGGFLDSSNSPVDPKSPNIFKFDPTYSGTVFLSDIWGVESNVSGVTPYKNLDFEWKQLQLKGEEGETIPKIIEFNNTLANEKMENSLFTIHTRIHFGDDLYSGEYTLSGWVNTDNPNWASLSGLVDSGVYVSGVDIAAIEGVAWDDIEDVNGNLHPSITANPLYSGQWIGYSVNAGYPFNNYDITRGRVSRFNDYTQASNGWWRPYSQYVTPTGLDPSVSTDNQLDTQYISTVPDFFFNNVPFYKIYKFNNQDTVINNTIKLYTYQQRPVNGEEGYYPVNFLWRYKSSWIDKIGTKTGVSHANFTGTNWSGYILPISGIRSNEEYVIDSVTEIKVNGTAAILDELEYNDQLNYTDGSLTGIRLDNLNSTRPNLNPQNVTFDYKYFYRIRNNYLSTWTGYAIVSPGATEPTVTIKNPNINNKPEVPIIKSIQLQNIQTGETTNIDPDGNLFTINLPMDQNLSGDQYFKITIFCASDDTTGFCANNWVPSESIIFEETTITVDPYIKLVPKITPIFIVDLSTLIYDTPMNNNNRAAIIETDFGEKFLVAKMPSKDTFPGYYFDSLNKAYVIDNDYQIKNIGHWIRKGSITESGVDGYSRTGPFTYTTGSNVSGVVYKKDRVALDATWNDSATLPDFPNYTGFAFYPHHTTYAYPVNITASGEQNMILYSGQFDPRFTWENSKIGSAGWQTQASSSEISDIQNSGFTTITTTNRGFLFYSTAENLSAFYSISYRKVSTIDDTNTRFLYKLELQSDAEGSLAPRVDSIKFSVNKAK